MAKKIEINDVLYLVFCVLLFFIPFNTRKIFPTQFTYFNGFFSEYMTYSLSLVDILAVILIVLCIIRARHDFKSLLIQESRSRINRIICLLTLWILFGVMLNAKYVDISFYQAARFSGYIGMAIMIKHIVNTDKRLIQSLLIFSLTGVIQSFIAIMQFIGQSSIFGDGLLHKLSGESLISRDVIGTSNIVYFGNKVIRAYGTLPHPNILAGYLVFTILISIYLYITVTQTAFKVKVLGKSDSLTCRLYSHRTLFASLICLQFIGLLLTFSRSGIVALFTVIFFNIVIFKNVSRGTFVSHLGQFRRLSPLRSHLLGFATTLFFLSLCISFSYVFILRMQNEFIGHQSTQDRVLLENVSRGTILMNPLIGTGIGTYVIYLYDNYSGKITNYWQFQPNHNSYLLIASEIGIPGVIMYLYLIYLIYSIVNKSANMGIDNANCTKNEICLFRTMIIAFLVIGFFDHYFWTSNQMRTLLWVLLGMFVSSQVMKQYVPRETF